MKKIKKYTLVYITLFLLLINSIASSSSNDATTTFLAPVDKKEESNLLIVEETESNSEKKNKNIFVQLGTYVRDSFSRFKDGTTQLYTNHQKCNGIRSKQKAFQALHYPNIKNSNMMKKRGITFEEFDFLQKQKLDRNKLGNIIFLMFFAPNVLPYAIMCFPDILPSPFCIPSGGTEPNSQETKWMSMSRTRAHAFVSTLLNIEKLSHDDPRDSPSVIPFGRKRAIRNFEKMKMTFNGVTSLLSEQTQTLTESIKNNNNKSLNSTLNEEQSLQAFENEIYTSDEPREDRRRLVTVPKPIIKGLSSIIPQKKPSFVENFTPHFLVRNQVLQHLRKLSEADEFLINEDINLPILSRELLMEICFDRCIGTPTSSKEELCASLSNWLELTVIRPSTKPSIDYDVSSFPTPKKIQKLKNDGVLVLKNKQQQDEIEYFNSNLARVVLMCRNAAESIRDYRCSSTLPKLLFSSM